MEGEAAVVIATCVDSRSSQSMGDLLAQPSAAPVPFQLDQSVAVIGNHLQPHGSATDPAANWTLVVVAVVVVFSVVVLRSSGMGGWRTKIDHTPTLRRFRIRRPGVVAPVSGGGGVGGSCAGGESCGKGGPSLSLRLCRPWRERGACALTA